MQNGNEIPFWLKVLRSEENSSYKIIDSQSKESIVLFGKLTKWNGQDLEETGESFLVFAYEDVLGNKTWILTDLSGRGLEHNGNIQVVLSEN